MVWLAALAKLHGELRMNKFKEAMHRHTQRNNGHYRMSEVNQDYSNLVPGTALRGVCVCVHVSIFGQWGLNISIGNIGFASTWHFLRALAL